MLIFLWSFFLLSLLALACSDYQEMSLLTRSQTAVLDDNQFNEYVIGHKRNYDTVLLFSYTNTSNECLTCIKSNDAFVRTAQQWKRMHVVRPRLIFMVITIDNESALYDTFGFTMYPTLLYLHETHAITEISEDEKARLVIEKDDTILTELEIQRFLTRITGVSLVEETKDTLTLIVFLLAAILLVFIGYIMLFRMDFFYSLLGTKETWSQICYGFIIVVVAGLFYDLLRKAPLLSVDRRGQVSLFSLRGATIVEGLIYGVTTVFISTMFYRLLTTISGEKEVESFEEDLSMRLFSIVGCFVIVVLCFIVKNPWYVKVFKFFGYCVC